MKIDKGLIALTELFEEILWLTYFPGVFGVQNVEGNQTFGRIKTCHCINV